jgi:uncharacterized protein with HEPN domain
MTPVPGDVKTVRDRLTHHCDEVTPAELFVLVTRHLDDAEAIASELRSAAAPRGGTH